MKLLCFPFLIPATAFFFLAFAAKAQDSAVKRSAPSFPRIQELVEEGINAKKMPGAVVFIGSRKGIHYREAFGSRAIEPKKSPMMQSSLFDLASLTKPVVTATSVMILIEEGRLRLKDSVAVHLPQFGQNGKRRITVQQLLTHTGGLIPDNALADYQDGPKVAYEKIYGLRPRWEPGTEFKYSDVGFIVLGKLVEKISGISLAEFAEKKIFKPLGMNETTFNPGADLKARAAITQKRQGKWMQGEVHDPRAFRLGGVAGHAGLFSTAADLSLYCQMLLNQGSLGGADILSPATIRVMTQSYDLPSSTRRALGWDKLSAYSSNRGELMSNSAFGHGGFTGTSIWIDPELDLFVIFLSNRVHPDGKGSINRLAGKIGSVAAASRSRELLRRRSE